MSTEKPKRVVGWKHYVLTLLDKGMGYSAATIAVFCGLIFLLIAVISLWLGCRGGDGQTILLFGGAFSILLGVVALGQGKAMFNNAKKVEVVAPITRHNTGLLPEVETLVRGSDRPATAEQTELLRAVRQTPDSPPEQLLRAIQENRQDV
jgi:hypothetical protein